MCVNVSLHHQSVRNGHSDLNGLILQVVSRKFQQDDKLERFVLQRAGNRRLNSDFGCLERRYTVTITLKYTMSLQSRYSPRCEVAKGKRGGEQGGRGVLTRQEALTKNRTKLESSAREATREPTKVSISGKRSFSGPAERKRDA